MSVLQVAMAPFPDAKLLAFTQPCALPPRAGCPSTHAQRDVHLFVLERGWVLRTLLLGDADVRKAFGPSSRNLGYDFRGAISGPALSNLEERRCLEPRFDGRFPATPLADPRIQVRMSTVVADVESRHQAFFAPPRDPDPRPAD